MVLRCQGDAVVLSLVWWKCDGVGDGVVLAWCGGSVMVVKKRASSAQTSRFKTRHQVFIGLAREGSVFRARFGPDPDSPCINAVSCCILHSPSCMIRAKCFRDSLLSFVRPFMIIFSSAVQRISAPGVTNQVISSVRAFC